MGSNDYVLVFDTNVLYMPHDKKGDFTRFSFSSTFHNVIDKIEELDLYPYVKVAIPDVVWEEAIQQKTEAYYEKLELVMRSTSKYKFPFCEFKVSDDETDYDSYLKEKAKKYKEELFYRQVKFITLDLPSEKRFPSIVARAIQKRPPFEGKKSNSDKGFKDALLWESILEFKEQHIKCNILFYTKDRRFNELITEFNQLFLDCHITIFSDEDEGPLLNYLESLAIRLDPYVYVPQPYKGEPIIRWLFSENFQTQFSRRVDGVFDVVNRLTSFTDIMIVEVYDILWGDAWEDGARQFSIFLNARIAFTINLDNAPPFIEDYDLVIVGDAYGEDQFYINEVYIHEGDGM